jgi:glycine dehydrogenase subunit 1
MSTLGKHGLQEVANLCYQKAHYAASELGKIKGFKIPFAEPFFHEFVLQTPKPASEVNQYLLDNGILGGYDLGKDYPTMKNHLLVAVTEMNSKDEIDTLVEILEEM